MDNKKKIIISVLCGIIAVLGVVSYLKLKERSLLEMSSVVYVLTATRDILQHTPIDETMIEATRFPKKYVQPGAVFVRDANTILGQVASTPILKGEQIVSTKLLSFGRDTGLAMKIPAGMRAISILVNDVTGVAGLIQPNDFVDILTTFDFGSDAKSKQYTYTLFQNISVLAINQNLGEGYSTLAKSNKQNVVDQLMQNRSSGSSYAVTLALTPQQVQDIVLSQEMGVITLALRGIGESEHEMTLSPSTPSELTGIQSLMKQNSRPRYREYRGGNR
ncbi:MAG: Flp pilus assembly protein CpaB [Pseudomonadota bacterium]